MLLAINKTVKDNFKPHDFYTLELLPINGYSEKKSKRFDTITAQQFIENPSKFNNKSCLIRLANQKVSIQDLKKAFANVKFSGLYINSGDYFDKNENNNKYENQELEELFTKINAKEVYLLWENINNRSAKGLRKIFSALNCDSFALVYSNLGSGRTNKELGEILGSINAKTLNLSLCHLTDTIEGKLDATVLEPINATNLILDDNSLGLTDDIAALGNAFKNLEAHTLSLSGNRLDNLSGKNLKNLFGNINATTLILRKNNLGIDSHYASPDKSTYRCEDLIAAFNALKNVTTIDLSDNGFNVLPSSYLRKLFQSLSEHPTIKNVILDKRTKSRLQKIFKSNTISISENIEMCDFKKRESWPYFNYIKNSLLFKKQDHKQTHEITFLDYVNNQEDANKIANALVFVINSHKDDKTLHAGKELFVKIPEMQALKELLIKILDNDLKVPDIIFSELYTSMFINYIVDNLKTNVKEEDVKEFQRTTDLAYQLLNDEKLQGSKNIQENIEFLLQIVTEKYNKIRNKEGFSIDSLNDDIFRKLCSISDENAKYKDTFIDFTFSDSADNLENDIQKRLSNSNRTLNARIH